MIAIVTLQVNFENEDELRDALDELEALGYSPQVEYDEEEVEDDDDIEILEEDEEGFNGFDEEDED